MGYNTPFGGGKSCIIKKKKKVWETEMSHFVCSSEAHLWRDLMPLSQRNPGHPAPPPKASVCSIIVMLCLCPRQDGVLHEKYSMGYTAHEEYSQCHGRRSSTYYFTNL